MSASLIRKYIWLVETLRRYGRVTRSRLDELWRKSPFSQGEGLPRRTLFNYRAAAEELFGIEILIDPRTFEYYLAESEDTHDARLAEWLLDSTATANLLTGSRNLAGRIHLESTPSAHVHLASIVEAMQANQRIRFAYQSYTRPVPTRDIFFEPYFVKLFRQRWYVIGLHVESGKIRTYALDRIIELTSLEVTFEIPEGFDADEYFRYSFGIVESHDEPRDIVLRADPFEAKYLRALPLHPTQSETVHEGYSLFHYRMRITEDLVREILAHGPRLVVESPSLLRAHVLDSLRETLEKYD